MRNRGNSTISIPFEGMQRSKPSNVDSYGGCNEIINTRRRDKVWRPIMPKKFIEAIPNSYDVFQHTALSDGEYVIVDDFNHLIFYSNGAYDSTKLDIELGGDETITDVKELGNYLTFTTNDRHINIFWNGSSYTESQDLNLDDLSLSASGGDSIFPYGVSEIKTIRDLNLEIGLGRQEMEAFYGVNGAVMTRVAVKLTDGRYVYQNSPKIAFQYDDDIFSRDVGTFFFRGSEYIGAGGNLGFNLEAKKIRIILTQEELDLLNRDSVDSIAVCITKPITNFDGFEISDIDDPDMDYSLEGYEAGKTKLENDGFIYLGESGSDPTTDTASFRYPFNDINDPSNIVDDGDYYILKEIPKSELVVGEITIEEDFDYSNLDLLSIDSTRYNEKLIDGELDVYNKRTHLFNYKRAMVSLNTFVEENFTFESVSSTFALADYYAEVTVFENGIENKITKLIGTSTSTTQILKFNSRYVGYANINATKLRIWAAKAGTTPDLTNIRSELVLEFKKHPALNLVYIDNYNATTHLYEKLDEYLSLSPTQIDLSVDVSIYDGIVDNDKDILLSDINYPLTYDSVNSYTFGDGKLIGLAAPTAALSEGQFGSFPLYAFTSIGVWVLSAGSGDVIYSSTPPVSREVAISREGIEGTELGVIFLARAGLILLVGSVPTRMSDSLRGKPSGLLSDNIEYQLSLGKSDIPEDHSDFYASFPSLWDYVDDVDFLDYISSDTIVGYSYGKDFEEVIICNPTFSYSYVFELKSGVFYKISSRWDRMRTNYPGLLGQVDSTNSILLYELSEEDDSGSANVLIETTPQLMNTERFKKVFRNTLRGYLKLHNHETPVNPNNPISEEATTKIALMALYVSEDGHNWSKYDDIQTNDDVVDINIIGGVSNQLYFKYVVVAQLDKDSNIDKIELDVKVDARDTME